MWSFSWLVSFSLTQSPVQSFALNEWVIPDALGRSALPGGFLTLKGKSQGVPRGIRIGGSGVGRGGAVVLWLAGRAAAHQWSGCAHGTWEQWPCGEERAGKELAQQTAPHQETPARGPDHTRPLPRRLCS